MRAQLCTYAALAFVMGLLATGCQTTPKEEPAPTTPVMADLRPASPVSLLHLRSGRYPNLYATNSRALWVDQDVANAKLEREVSTEGELSPLLVKDGQTITQNYYVIEMQLGSQFPDASIAYDVVGLRTIDVYLLLPDGSRVWPVQRVMGSSATESNIGAIKTFGRTNLVAFPKVDVLTGQPTLPPGVTGVQLVLDGFNSEFDFEWAFVPSVDPAAPAPAEGGGMSFSEFVEKLRELSRITQ